MITVLARFSRLRAVLGRQGDPYLRGRALQLSGTALLADGLVGLENPLDGRRTRSGILSSLGAVAVIALMLFVLGWAVRSGEPFPDGAIATGTVTDVQHGRGDSFGSCGATVGFTVDGTEHEAHSTSSSGSLCSAGGEQVQVSYRPSDPEGGRPQFTGDSTVLRVISVVLWVLLVLSVLSVLLRAAEILAGGWLVLRGRSLVRSAGPVPAGHVVGELRAAWDGPSARSGGPGTTS